MFVSAADRTALKNIINYAIQYHDKLTQKWFDTHEGQLYNLKRKYVTDVNGNSDGLLDYVFDYINFLNNETFDFSIKIGDYINSSYKITSRAKDPSSVQYKIKSYSTKGDGSYPIKKCLNDLFGFRLIHDGCWSFEEISEFCAHEWNTKNIKCLDAAKNGYIATHIYISYDNYAFPWELQVWNSCDEKKNIENHHIYKQEYTKWVENTRGGSLK